MPLFHTTLSLGRSDSLTVECSSKSKLLEFFKIVSKAVVRNIKEIVFSKDYNINYTPYTYIQEDTYSKVIIQATSANYAETYVLFNIKKTVTQKDIEKEFKQLLINNEPILDFIDITFYSKGDSPTNYNNLYQVQYKRNSKTYIENFYAKDYKIVLELSKNLIGGEITEIRKFVHYDERIKIDSGIGYIKSVSTTLLTDNSRRFLKIPKVDTSLSHPELIEYISNTFTIFGKPINKDKLNLKYS